MKSTDLWNFMIVRPTMKTVLLDDNLYFSATNVRSSVYSDSGEVLKQMGAGDFFGEIGILNMDGGINR